MIKHIPVLADKVLEFINENDKIFVDGTLGHGGHTKKILENFPDLEVLAFDLDEKILERTKYELKSFPKIEFFNQNYFAIERVLQEKNKKADVVLLDIGVNLEHFKDADRGFSIKFDGPLDMRFSKKNKISAYDVINFYSFDQLLEIFVSYTDFGEDFCRKIVNMILEKRKIGKIETTLQLKNIFKEIPLSDKKIAVFFQAIRIYVNQELENLGKFIDSLPNILGKNGRCLIISYHSGEDRLIKSKFGELKKSGNFELLTKHAICPNWKEIEKNKAARSARLRVIKKIK